MRPREVSVVAKDGKDLLFAVISAQDGSVSKSAQLESPIDGCEMKFHNDTSASVSRKESKDRYKLIRYEPL